MSAGGMPAGRFAFGEPVVDHAASFVFLQTRMKTGGRSSSPSRPRLAQLLPREREQPDRVLRLLQHRLGLRVRPLAAALGARSACS